MGPKAVLGFALWWLSLLLVARFSPAVLVAFGVHVSDTWLTRLKNSNAARACAWCQLTSPALIFMSLCCGDGVPSSTALGASSVRVHGSSAVSLMSLYGPLCEFFSLALPC